MVSRDALVEGERLGQRVVRGDPGRRERQLVPGADLELVGVPAVDRARQPRAAQDQPVGAGDGGDHLGAVHVLAPHPGPDRAVAEPHHPLVPDGDGALDADHPPDQVGPAVRDRHHVEHAQPAGRRRPGGLQRGAVADVAAGHLGHLARRAPAASGRARDRPAARRSRRGSRSAAGRASPPSRPCRPGRRCRGPRGRRSPRSATAWGHGTAPRSLTAETSCRCRPPEVFADR